MIYNQMVCGDCISTLNNGPEGWVDLVFADPPFNIGFEYDGYNDSRKLGDYLQFTRDWLGAVYRALKWGGSLYVAIGDEFAGDLSVIARRELGFTMRNWLVWHYTFGQQTSKKFAKSHTHILYLVKSQKAFTFNADAVRVVSARQAVYGDKRARSGGKVPDDTWYLRPQDAEGELFEPGVDTWHVPRVCGTFKEREGFHGCQMPQAILDRIIKVSSNRGDVVLDPFCGSGTTVVAAKELGRRWVGIEQSAHYVLHAQRRINKLGEERIRIK